MQEIDQIINLAREMNASDIHISEGKPLSFRIWGSLTEAPLQYDADKTREIILSMLTSERSEMYLSGEDVDFAIEVDGNRQRVNAFHYQRKLAATIRLLNNDIPALEDLGLPDVLRTLADSPRGLILVTGPTGSGKSTTLAAMIDYINKSRAEHILTIEDPIEYVYTESKSIIHQREVGEDVGSFAGALRSALREDPDVILVGEMRDYETISAALTAAETGHLVMSTLHTTGAAQSVERIIDACPVSAQSQVRIQLASVLQGIITQCLIPQASGEGRSVATEILLGTDAALNLIRENKGHQMNSVMQAGAASGMHTLNGDLQRLVRARKITPDNAYKYSNDKKELASFIGF